MARLQRVLVAFDGSPQSREALHWAIYFSRHSGSAITAVKVFEPILSKVGRDEIGVNYLPETFQPYVELEKADKKLIEDVKAFGQEQGVEIAAELLHGHVAQTLLDYAKTNNIGLIVTGTRGLGELKKLLTGSVTRKLVSLAHVPVLIVKKCPLIKFSGGSLIVATLRKILVAYDGSSPSRKALGWAVEIARPVRAQIVAMKVREALPLSLAFRMSETGSQNRLMEALKEIEQADIAMMAEAKEFARQLGAEITTEFRDGNAAAALLAYADKEGADLIVCGARGHGILDRILLGSVASSLVNLAAVPVLVVKN